MNEVVCVSVSVYRDALTRGKHYEILAIDGDRRQIRVTGDNGRTRWFPTYCFDQSGRSVPTLASYLLGDRITPHEDLAIEVIVHLSDGDRRRCFFATPSALASCGDWIEGTQVTFHYANRHVIIATELSEDLIGRMLRYIDGQGGLLECTLPIVPTNDEMDASQHLHA